MTHFKYERTLVLLKPDAIQRILVGDIIKRYERVGLKIMAMKMLVPTEQHIEKHYTLDPTWRQVTGEKVIKGFIDKGKTPPTTDPLAVTEAVLRRLKAFMTSGPIIAMVLQGAHAIQLTRKITGSTEPLMSDVGTIRGDYVLDSYEMCEGDDRAIRNLVHASGSVEEAEREIKHWFADNEIISYTHVQDKILYDINLDGILD